MEQNIIIFIILGFIAQIIDGCLGMAYGVSANTFLLTIGISPAAASASVHTAEIFTTAVSGYSHYQAGNVSKELFKRLLIPGVIGGALGAYILTALPTDIIKPIVAIYLALMGARILYKAFQKNHPDMIQNSKMVLLGLTGGFLDAIGGGGWGPIVTSTLMARGNNPRKTIGSVNLTEFFVTLAESITFILTIGLVHWQIILGLIIGGVIAAPLGALIVKWIPKKTLMILVGVLIILLSIRTIFLALS